MKEGIDVTKIREALSIAKEIVKDEEEPYRSEAFKIIFSSLIKSVDLKTMPENIMAKIKDLTNKERIQLILYFADKPLTKDEIKTKSLEYGIDEGWWNGSNFRRDLIKRSRVIIEEKGEDGITRYRLTEAAKVETRKLIENI